MEKYKLNERIEIEWLDAYSDAEWQEYSEAIKPPSKAKSKSIGYFLKQDDKFVYFSSMIGAGKKGLRDRHVIPLGTITKIRTLKPERKGLKK